MSKFFAPSLRLSALLGTAILSMPTAAFAQTFSTDSAYLNDLYGFLQSQNDLAYTMATEYMDADYNIWAAQTFCEAFASGVSPENAFAAYADAAMSEAAIQAATQGIDLPYEVGFTVGFYGGAVMMLGSAYYCPEYQPQVEQALRSL